MPCASPCVVSGSVQCRFANNSHVLTCLIKVATAIKLRKVMGFLPFVMNNYSWGDPLGKNPVPHPTFHPRVFFLAVLELHCREDLSSSCGERGLLPSCGAQATGCGAQALGARASVAVARGLRVAAPRP